MIRPRNDRALRVIGTVLLVGVVARVLMAAWFVPAWEASAGVGSFPDAYPVLARSILDEGTLGYGEYGATPTTLRGPGFPLWLALGMLFGLSGPIALGLWTSVPGLVCGALIARLLARRYGNAAGLFGGLVAVAHPLVVFTSARTMGDEVYGVLGFVAIAALVLPKGRKTFGAGSVVLSATASALQILTRATGILTWIAIALTGLLFEPRLRRRAAVVLLAAAIPVAAWSVRSSLLERRPVIVHSLLGYNFWFGEALFRLGESRDAGATRKAAYRLIADKAGMPEFEDPNFWYAGLEPGESSRMERRLLGAAREQILSEPLAYLRRCLLGTVRFWIGADSPRRASLYAAAGLPLLLLALIGLVERNKLESGIDPLVLPLAVTVVLHDLAYAAVWPMARMSVQVYPALAYLAAVGLAYFVSVLRPRPAATGRPPAQSPR